jgi:hypothetical protein
LVTSVRADQSTDDLPRQLAQLVQLIGDDIARRLDPGTPRSQVITHVTAALRELNTSIWSGALREMATSLAEHRLRNKRSD